MDHIYRAVDRSFTPGPGLLANVDDPRQGARLAAGLVLDPARTESEAMIEKKLGGGSTIGEVGRLLVLFSDQQAQEFVRRLDQFCGEFQSQSHQTSGEGDQEPYAFSFVFAPMDLGTKS